MFDLALTEQGDILFERNLIKDTGLKVSFNFANSKTLRVNFKVEDYVPLIQTNHSLKVSFEIERLNEYDQVVTLNESDAKIQAIKIRLQTALGSLPFYPTIGSELEIYKHKSLNNKLIQKAIQDAVTKAISDLITNPAIRLEAVSGTNGKEYVQKLVIYIYEDEMLIYKYDLKG